MLHQTLTCTHLDNIKNQGDAETINILLGIDSSTLSVLPSLDSIKTLWYPQNFVPSVVQLEPEQQLSAKYPREYIKDNFENAVEQTVFFVYYYSSCGLRRVAAEKELIKRGWELTQNGWKNQEKQLQCINLEILPL